MSKQEGRFLRQRADEFLHNARSLLTEGVYNLAAFNLEQASQLYLKYYLFLKLGNYPKIHSLTELLEDLGNAYGAKNKVDEFWRKNAEALRNLENAYLTTRYFPLEYRQIEVEKMLTLVNRLIALLNKL